MRGKREYELAVRKPGDSVLGGIELIDVIDKQVLLGEFLQVDNQRLRRTVEVPLAMEEGATQRIDESTGKSG